METGRDEVQEKKRVGFPSALKRRLWPLWYSLIVGSFLFDHPSRHPGGAILWKLAFALGVLSVFSPGWFARLVLWTVGTPEYIEISDAGLIHRKRERYKSQIGQLSDLGFGHLFFEGATFSLRRLPLVLPALMMLSMWIVHRVVTTYSGTRFLIGFPTLASGDSSAYAQVSGLGVLFRTTFKDGTILETKNFGNEDIPTGSTIVRHCFRFKGISGTWDEHKNWIQMLETENNPVVRDLNFQAFVEIICKVNADLRLHA